MKTTISMIRAANKAAGFHYFERAAMRWFDSRVERTVYEGPGGIFLITSEQFHGSSGSAPRKWTVRQFDPKTGEVETVKGHKFNVLYHKSDAQTIAKALARGTTELPIREQGMSDSALMIEWNSIRAARKAA